MVNDANSWWLLVGTIVERCIACIIQNRDEAKAFNANRLNLALVRHRNRSFRNIHGGCSQSTNNSVHPIAVISCLSTCLLLGVRSRILKSRCRHSTKTFAPTETPSAARALLIVRRDFYHWQNVRVITSRRRLRI
jgi:hypothetical protein